MRKDRPLKKLNKFKYKELAYFCYQYSEWVSQIRDIKHNLGVSGVNYDGMPHAHNTASSVENLAIKLAMLNSRIELIEKAAMTAFVMVLNRRLWLLERLLERRCRG